MEPSYRTIAELFQVPTGPVDVPESAARKKVGETADESDELGRLSLNDGDYEGAMAHFRRAIEQRDANDITSRINLAGAMEYSDQFPGAMRQYLAALRAKRDAAEPHVGLSDLYKRYARWQDAIEELRQAIELEPNNSFYHFKLAEMFREMGERKRALDAIQHAIVAKPDEPFYHYWMGDLLIDMRRYPESLDAFRAAIELSPGDDHLYLRAAVAFWCANRRPEAIKSVRLASDLAPEKDLYHGLIGVMLEESGQLIEANQESERASRMDRFDHDHLGRLMDEMGIEP